MYKVLIIDDSQLSIMRLKQFLGDGYEIHTASNGSEGLSQIKSLKPDFVLSDLLMPVMDGYELLKTLKEEKNTIPVIVITADIQETTRKKVMEMGAFAVINKPSNSKILLDIILEVLKSRSIT